MSSPPTPLFDTPATKRALNDLTKFLIFSDNVLDCRLCFFEHLLKEGVRKPTKRRSPRTTSDIIQERQERQAGPYKWSEWMSLYALRGDDRVPTGYLSHCANVDPLFAESVSRVLWRGRRERDDEGADAADGGAGGENSNTPVPLLYRTLPSNVSSPSPSTYDYIAFQTDQQILRHRRACNLQAIRLLEIVTHAPWHHELVRSRKAFQAAVVAQYRLLPTKRLPADPSSATCPTPSYPYRQQLLHLDRELKGYAPLLQHTRPGSPFVHYANTLRTYLQTYNAVLDYFLKPSATTTDYRQLVNAYAIDNTRNSPAVHIRQLLLIQRRLLANTASTRSTTSTTTKTDDPLHTPDAPPDTPFRDHRISESSTLLGFGVSSGASGESGPVLESRMVLMDNVLPSISPSSTSSSTSSSSADAYPSFGGALVAYATLMSEHGPLMTQVKQLRAGVRRGVGAKWTASVGVCSAGETCSVGGVNQQVRPVLDTLSPSSPASPPTSLPTSPPTPLHDTLFLRQLFQMLRLPEPNSEPNSSTSADSAASDAGRWCVTRYHINASATSPVTSPVTSPAISPATSPATSPVPALLRPERLRQLYAGVPERASSRSSRSSRSARRSSWRPHTRQQVRQQVRQQTPAQLGTRARRHARGQRSRRRKKRPGTRGRAVSAEGFSSFGSDED